MYLWRPACRLTPSLSNPQRNQGITSCGGQCWSVRMWRVGNLAWPWGCSAISPSIANTKANLDFASLQGSLPSCGGHYRVQHHQFPTLCMESHQGGFRCLPRSTAACKFVVVAEWKSWRSSRAQSRSNRIKISATVAATRVIPKLMAKGIAISLAMAIAIA